MDFPLLEWDPEEKRYGAMHHPFTSPIDEDLAKLDTDPGSVRDFQAFARQTGNELLEQTSANDEFVHFLRRR